MSRTTAPSPNGRHLAATFNSLGIVCDLGLSVRVFLTTLYKDSTLDSRLEIARFGYGTIYSTCVSGIGAESLNIEFLIGGNISISLASPSNKMNVLNMLRGDHQKIKELFKQAEKMKDSKIRQGHEVTLFASGDSSTKARLIAASERGLRLNSEAEDYLAYNVLQLEQVLQQADAFDIIHFHIDYIHFPFLRRSQTASVTTLHGRLDRPELIALFRKFDDLPVISISDAQRGSLPTINWQGTVYHGLPLDLYRQGRGLGDYLVFLGRISPEKRVDRAIEIAKRAKSHAQNCEQSRPCRPRYMETKIRPLLDDPLIEFIGEIERDEKEKFLGEAHVLLFPIDWSERFGLVMIEAMACGTPVIAYRDGSVPEVIDPGLTGFVVESIEESLDALDKIQHLDRNRCRQVFEQRFSSARMADDYLRI